MSRTFGHCKHCGETLWEPDFRECSHCACLTSGVWVQTPADGPGEIVQVRHSGGLVVMLQDGRTRQFSGSDLSIQVDPAPAREPGCDDEPATIATTPQDEPEDLDPIVDPAPAPMFTADRTSDCAPLVRDLDPLARIRRELLARPFPAWALMPQPR